ncbi:MAG: sel1 repeat family protein [Elusimicrobiota bacterium]|jgi:TPR repeat protein|nr:sel1 repeat family protein [Elusimicrobiota bacterium]
MNIKMIFVCLFFLCLGMVSCSQSGESLFKKAQQYGRNGNTEKAFQYYKQSAEKGYAEAQFRLALMYTDGKGVKRDYGESVKWFRKAAEQGDADAQHSLGIAYYAGRGVKQNYGEAMNWFRKAAEQGDENAKLKLEILYRLLLY